MELTEIGKAAVASMLADLRADPDHVIPDRDIKPVTTKAQRAEIAELAQLLAQDRKQSRAISAALPAGSEAAAYWRSALRAINASKLAENLGSPSHRKSAARLSEQAEEAWERVEAEHHRHFIFHNLDGSGWDDRWHNLEWKSPLLRRDDGSAMPNPANYAQQQVLSQLIERSEPTDDIAAKPTLTLIGLAKRLRR